MKFKQWLENTDGLIRMWHGGTLEGDLEVRSPSKGRYEAGPGIYLTSSYERARKYSKGGKSTFLVTLKSNINYAHNVNIELNSMTTFLGNGKKSNLIKQDLINYSTRTGKSQIPAEVLINLFVNHEAGSGQNGLKLINFLVENGVDANFHRSTGDEVWIVVMNPKIIVNIQKIPANKVDLNQYNLPNEYLN